METFDVVIVGAGAAGLFCAGRAGQRGQRVLLLDHSPKVAEKIRISGGGRALGGSGNRLPRPQPPPSCSTEIEHLSFMFVPGMAISISRTFRRTHSASSDSLGTQYLSKLVGS